MNEDKTPITLIEKEDLGQIAFPPEEVLTDLSSKNERSEALHKAASLGNLEKYKVLITYADAESTKEVFTTIWAVTDKKVIFKGGRVIPANRILKVKFS
jgi:hypothetical protein